jgi:hypothetical protein
MAFISGSVNDLNPGAVLAAALHTKMLEVGFTLVDTVIIGANTHKVYEMLAAGNPLGYKWYCDIGYQTTGGPANFAISAFEDYSVAAHTGIRGPFSSPGSAALTESVYHTRFGAANHALETNWAPRIAYGLGLALTTAAFGYWASITPSRVAFCTTINVTDVYYAGLYTPTPEYAVMAGAKLYPLLAGTFNGGVAANQDGTAYYGSQAFGLTRCPPYYDAGLNNTAKLHAQSRALPIAAGWPNFPSGSTVGPGGYKAARLRIRPQDPNAMGAAYGDLIGVWLAPTTGIIRGDTAKVDGVTCTMMQAASGWSIMMENV